MSENPCQFGVNLWWTVPVLQVEAKVAQELLIKHGFSKDDLKEPSDRMEVSRAVQSFQNRRTKENRRLAEIADEQIGRVVYGILDREQVEGDQVSFEQRTTVAYDKERNVVTVTGELSGEVEQALEEYKDKITDQDVRCFLRNMVRKCYGVAKRPSGGIYFVPCRFVQKIEAAKQFLAELAVGARLYVERVVDGEEERKIVWEAVEADIDDQLQKVLGAAERVERRISSLHNHAAKVDDLRELMVIYQDLLGKEAEHEEVAQKIEDAVNVIAKKMADLQTLVAAGGGSKKQTKETSEAYFAAVREVLKDNGPLMDVEIAKRVQAKGYQGEVPTNLYSFLLYRAKKGLLKLVSARKFALPDLVVQPEQDPRCNPPNSVVGLGGHNL